MSSREDIQPARFQCNRCRSLAITMHTPAGFGRCHCGGSIDEIDDPPTVDDKTLRDWDPSDGTDDDDDDDDGEEEL